MQYLETLMTESGTKFSCWLSTLEPLTFINNETSVHASEPGDSICEMSEHITLKKKQN